MINEKRVKFNIDENNKPLNNKPLNDKPLNDKPPLNDKLSYEGLISETSLNNEIISNNTEINSSLEFKLDMIISNQKIILEILKKNNLLETPEEESHTEVVNFDAI